jgi:pimeloyl-ACP methyl ester carboxylesterase
LGRKEGRVGALEKKLYIIHGWTTDTKKWGPFLEKLKTENIEVNFLKVPGLTAPIDKPWIIDDYVEWLNTQIPLNRRVTILGHSNGGRIALSFVLKYPEKVEHLFLLNSAGIIHNDLITRTKRGVFGAIAKIGKKVTSADLARDFLYKLAQESDYRVATPLMRETMKNLVTVNLLPRFSEINLPTTIIWGKHDRVTPYSDARIFKDGIKNSKLFTIESGRHSPQFTHVDEVVKIIKENI